MLAPAAFEEPHHEERTRAAQTVRPGDRSPSAELASAVSPQRCLAGGGGNESTNRSRAGCLPRAGAAVGKRRWNLLAAPGYGLGRYWLTAR